MKKSMSFVIVLFVALSMVMAGCGPKKEASSSAAIEKSKSLQTTEEKVDYLIKQAEAFYNSEDFQSAVDIAQHILSALDKDSAKAKELIEKAKEQLKGAAKDALKNIGK